MSLLVSGAYVKIIKNLQDDNVEIFQRGTFLTEQIIIMFKLFTYCYNTTQQFWNHPKSLSILEIILHQLKKYIMT